MVWFIPWKCCIPKARAPTLTEPSAVTRRASHPLWGFCQLVLSPRCNVKTMSGIQDIGACMTHVCARWGTTGTCRDVHAGSPHSPVCAFTRSHAHGHQDRCGKFGFDSSCCACPTVFRSMAYIKVGSDSVLGLVREGGRGGLRENQRGRDEGGMAHSPKQHKGLGTLRGTELETMPCHAMGGLRSACLSTHGLH